MKEDYEFNAEIKPVGEFRVGDTVPGGNGFKLSIEYRGKEAVKLSDCTFRLLADIGPGQTALVQNQKMAKEIETKISADIEIDGFPPPDKNQFVWEVTSYDDTPFNKNNPIEITFSNIISQTEPGKVKFTFEARIPDQKVQAQLIGELVKQSGPAGIIYFYSTTEERQNNLTTSESIVPADEKIFPGEKVILKWYVNKLRKETLKLEKSGISMPDVDFKKDKGTIVVEDIRENTDFILSCKVDNESEQKKSKVKVEVLQYGWHESTKKVDGVVGLEPTLLFNANNQTIYAVFRRNKEEGLLFQTGNPFWGWSSIKSSVPEGFVTSPGVYCDDKLWFIGGSQIDPDKASNKVCCFDPHKRRWEELNTVPWSPRMGHACLRIPPDEKKNRKEQIWVMGGCDMNGNPLKDVWALDVSSKQWDQIPIELPSERCMFSSVIFNNDIWLCGGLIDPLSEELSCDIFVFLEKKKGWQKKNKGLSFIEGEPMTACLQVFQKKLHIVGKTRKRSGAIEAFNYYLKTPTTEDWEKLSSDALQGWGEDLTLSYQIINFKDKLLIAKAMGYEKPNCMLKVYVPE